MATPKKLPSGNWRVRVYDYTDESGVRRYRSFTAATRKDCAYMAAEFAQNKARIAAGDLTVAEAIDEYIRVKSEVLSPSTIRGYKKQRRNYYKSIEGLRIRTLTTPIIQEWINRLSGKLSPKTVANIHGLLMAALAMFAPEIRLNPTLPRRIPSQLHTPSDTDVKALLVAIDDKELYLAVLLAAFGPLRRGEICALESTDIHGNYVTVSKSMVKADNGDWIVQPRPKTDASFRTVDFPEFVTKYIPEKEGPLFDITPDQISNRFHRVILKNDLPHFRFHDLRHYAASIMHAIGVPDQYIMQRGGWATDGVMKKVYRDTIDEQTIKMTQTINQYFSEFKSI